MQLNVEIHPECFYMGLWPNCVIMKKNTCVTEMQSALVNIHLRIREVKVSLILNYFWPVLTVFRGQFDKRQ